MSALGRNARFFAIGTPEAVVLGKILCYDTGTWSAFGAARRIGMSPFRFRSQRRDPRLGSCIAFRVEEGFDRRGKAVKRIEQNVPSAA